MAKMKKYDKIGELVEACLLADWETHDIVEEVARQFHGARTDGGRQYGLYLVGGA